MLADLQVTGPVRLLNDIPFDELSGPRPHGIGVVEALRPTTSANTMMLGVRHGFRAG